MKNLINNITQDKMHFEIYDDGTAILCSADEDITSAKIPHKVEGAVVTEIGDQAFANCTALETLILPEFDYDAWILDELFLEQIGANAFMCCRALTEINIPASVKTVCHGAFCRCSSLKKVTIEEGPGYPTYLEPYVFSDCTSLTDVSLVNYASEGLFDGCESLTYLPLAKGVDSIGERCFAHCTSLTEITIPSSVTEIEQLAFRSCYNLTHAKFESPKGWYESCRYLSFDEPTPLDLSSPTQNARWLRSMDFDDGVIRWYKKK